MVHGLIGGADVIFNHELIARIPSQPGSRAEECLHSARELIFATLFFSLAWYEWHGAACLFIVALLLGEMAVSTVDAVLELDVRVLPTTERVAHVLLFVNFGIVVTLVGQAALAWSRLPTDIVATSHGTLSWVLSGLAVLALGWSIRDALSAVRRNAQARKRQNA